MKKLSSKKILKNTKQAALNKGVSILPGSDADKTVTAVIETGVGVANEGIDIAAKLGKKGGALLERARDRIHKATAPRK